MDYMCRLGSLGDSSTASCPSYGYTVGTSFVPAVLLFVFTLFRFPSSSVSLSYINLTVYFLKCS